MKRVSIVTLSAMLLAAVVAPLVNAQPRRVVTIASGWVVGVYYPLAGAMSRIAYNAKDLKIRATVEATGASVANAQLIGTGEADFALLQNDIAFYAYNGIALDVFKGKPVKNMVGIFTIYPELVHVVASQASGAKSIRELKGKRVILGPPGSGTEQNALQTLAVYGIKEPDLASAERIDAAAAAEELKGGRVDAAFFTTGLGSAVLVDLFLSGKVTLVPIDHVPGEALRREYPFYTLEKIPAHTYQGQEREALTPAVLAMLVARRDLSEDLVYKFTRAIFDNLAQFHTAHAAARSLTLPTAQNGMPLPLHPGAERFYREKGMVR
ncbi:MAG TPA: TAXI family TRAP transporter solute-binding subunit [Candidatus Acidoferrum sp.]|nr:TAXI family TRAP transporter solute-binding subunit [Candidatus Acidoferrum sp.]